MVGIVTMTTPVLVQIENYFPSEACICVNVEFIFSRWHVNSVATLP